MINSVRNTVLSILNKNNYGYISPSDFNLFAKQAQMDIFNSYFGQYNDQINKENARISGVDYADIRKDIEENIDIFSVNNPLRLFSSNKYFLPSLSTTGDQFRMITKIESYVTLLSSGITTAIAVANNECEDSSATFLEDGVSAGDVVALTVLGVVEYVTVISVTETVITTTGVVWSIIGTAYAVYRTSRKEAERVSNSRIHLLTSFNFIGPKTTQPAYTQEGELAVMYPEEINTVGRVRAQYIRYPKDPKWTFIELTSGEPVFDQSPSDYMDFELPVSAEMILVSIVLQYAGMSIREITAVQFGQAKEQSEDIQVKK